MGLIGDWAKSKRMKDPVDGTALVVGASMLDPSASSGNYRATLVVEADGVAATTVEHSGIASAAKWPQPGSKLPITVDRSDPSRIKIRWDDVERTGDVIKREADAIAASMRTGGVTSTTTGTVSLDPANLDAATVAQAAAQAAPGVIKRGSAAEMLATGQRMQAILVGFKATGQTVGQVNPDSPTPNDPLYVLKLQLQIDGGGSLDGMVIHRVPSAIESSLKVGMHLNVAVDPANPTRAIAVDWDAS